jgi:hypothetical protein
VGSTEIELVRDPNEIAALPVEQQGLMITRALQESRTWLTVAVQSCDLAGAQQVKGWTATVAELTRQKQLAEEIQFDAQEMLRRAERGVALVLKDTRTHGGDRKSDQVALAQLDPATSVYTSHQEYRDAKDMALVESDEEFEKVLADARTEKNVSRKAVARKSRARVEPEETYVAEVGEPTCVPIVYREALLEEIHAWNATGSELVTRLSQDERDVMHQALLRLDRELRNAPVQRFEDEK